MTNFTCIEWIQVLLIGIGLLLIAAPTVYLMKTLMKLGSSFKDDVSPEVVPLAKLTTDAVPSHRPVPIQVPQPHIRIEEVETSVRAGDLKKTAKMHFGRMLRSSQQLRSAISRENVAEPPIAPEIPDTSEMWMKRIFILDDDASSGMTLALLVANLGYEPVTCQSPTEALVRLLAEPFDLLLTDYQMLLLNGLQLAQALRNNDCKIPIVLISGDIAEIDLFLAEQLNVRTILSKPVAVASLKEILENILHIISKDSFQENPVQASQEQKTKL